MQTEMISPDDIRFNPSEGTYDARVTVRVADMRRTYACSVEGDMALSFDAVQRALRADALRRYHVANALCSYQRTLRPAPMRATARLGWRTKLLRALPLLQRRRAA